MKQALPSCLVRLGLNLQADERAIRRAYAQRLKQLNPDTDPRGFQSLRHAYESALNWHIVDRKELPAHVPADVPTAEPVAAPATQTTVEMPRAPEPADVPPAPEPTPALPVPAPIAGPSVTDLLDLLRHKLDSAALPTPSDVRAWLSTTLDTETLIDLAARFAFERGVAVLLAEGWKPGKELLFGPAMDGFGWSQEDGHLSQFGQPGHFVAMAVRDLQVIEAQPDEVKLVMHDLARQLRTGTRPDTSVLLAQLPWLEQMVKNHPYWLHIVTDVTGLQRWRTWEREIPPWRCWLARRRAARAARAAAGVPPGPIQLRHLVIALMVLGLLMALLGVPLPAMNPRPSMAKPVAAAGSTLAPDRTPPPPAAAGH